MARRSLPSGTLRLLDFRVVRYTTRYTKGLTVENFACSFKLNPVVSSRPHHYGELRRSFSNLLAQQGIWTRSATKGATKWVLLCRCQRRSRAVSTSPARQFQRTCETRYQRLFGKHREERWRAEPGRPVGERKRLYGEWVGKFTAVSKQFARRSGVMASILTARMGSCWRASGTRGLSNSTKTSRGNPRNGKPSSGR